MNALLMQKFDEVVASIHARLKERGFRKARLHFARWRGDNLQVIGFQKSRHNGIMQSRLDFFVNAGVMDPLVVKTMFEPMKQVLVSFRRSELPPRGLPAR